jgi:hypothetical protein
MYVITELGNVKGSITTDRRSPRQHSCQCDLGCSFGIRGYWSLRNGSPLLLYAYELLLESLLGFLPELRPYE